MKNWNDAGTVHFNEETNRAPFERTISFFYLGVKITYVLLIPAYIFGKLNSADFDAVVEKSKATFRRKALESAGRKEAAEFQREAVLAMRREACEFLYDEFLVRQAKAGDGVWAVPLTMQDVGPPPEEDERYNVGNGVLQ